MGVGLLLVLVAADALGKNCCPMDGWAEGTLVLARSQKLEATMSSMLVLT